MSPMTVSPYVTAAPPMRFLEASPLRMARRYADAELRGRANSSEVQWLYEHPLLWMRALQRITRDVQNHIAKDRAGLASLRPKLGEPASAEYLAAKAGQAERTTNRLHFAQVVDNRLEEVKVLLGPQPAVGFVMVGDLIGIVQEIAELADAGDLAAAADKAHYHAKRWAERAQEMTP